MSWRHNELRDEKGKILWFIVYEYNTSCEPDDLHSFWLRQRTEQYINANLREVGYSSQSMNNPKFL